MKKTSILMLGNEELLKTLTQTEWRATAAFKRGEVDLGILESTFAIDLGREIARRIVRGEMTLSE